MFIIQAEASRSLTKHRKIASSFRDTQLFEIFQLACSLLRTAAGNIKTLDFSDENQVMLSFYSSLIILL
jgi:exportin-7